MLKNKHWIEVMGQPMGKQRPKATTIDGFARVYTPRETINYENKVQMYWVDKYGKEQLKGALHIEIVAYFQLNKTDYTKKGELTKGGKRKLRGEERPTKKPDIDNIIKAVLDGLNGVAFHDDQQIVFISARKEYSLQPSVEITIHELVYEENKEWEN